MASRGRGGRGGRGYTPPTGAQLYLQRSAQECGLDDRNLRTLQDITRPFLFPDLLWHSQGHLWNGEADPVAVSLPSDGPATTTTVPTPTATSSTNIALIRKGREMHHRMQTSACYIRPVQEIDVVRYSKRPRSVTAPEKVILEPLGSKGVYEQYLPEELVSPTRLVPTTVVSTANATKLTLEELEAREVQRRLQEAGGAINADGVPVVPGEEAPLEDAGDDISLEEQEEEDAEDYVMNYYESEGDESDGAVDDGEPTF